MLDKNYTLSQFMQDAATTKSYNSCRCLDAACRTVYTPMLLYRFLMPGLETEKLLGVNNVLLHPGPFFEKKQVPMPIGHVLSRCRTRGLGVGILGLGF